MAIITFGPALLCD